MLIELQALKEKAMQAARVIKRQVRAKRQANRAWQKSLSAAGCRRQTQCAANKAAGVADEAWKDWQKADKAAKALGV